MPITHEKGIEELDKLKKKPDSQTDNKKAEPNENNVPDPEGEHPPMYSK